MDETDNRESQWTVPNVLLGDVRNLWTHGRGIHAHIWRTRSTSSNFSVSHLPDRGKDAHTGVMCAAWKWQVEDREHFLAQEELYSRGKANNFIICVKDLFLDLFPMYAPWALHFYLPSQREARFPPGHSSSVDPLCNWAGLQANLEKEMATHAITLAWRVLWTEEPGGLLSMGSHIVGHNWSNLACMHALEKEMAAHSSILAWRIPGTEEPGGLLSMGSHRVGYDWSNLAAATSKPFPYFFLMNSPAKDWKPCLWEWICDHRHSRTTKVKCIKSEPRGGLGKQPPRTLGSWSWTQDCPVQRPGHWLLSPPCWGDNSGSRTQQS